MSIHLLTRCTTRQIATTTSTTTRTSIPRLILLTQTQTQIHKHIHKMSLSTNTTGREPSTEEKSIIDAVLDLYQLRPSDKAYSRYAENAVFHDPVSIAEGLESIKSQFNGMPKIFEESVTKQCAILPTPPNSNSIILDLTQHYVFKGKHTPEKTMNSKITLKRNAEGLVEHHEEEWDHEPNKTGEDGFLGKLQELRKKAGAKIVEMGVSSDPKKI